VPGFSRNSHSSACWPGALPRWVGSLPATKCSRGHHKNITRADVEAAEGPKSTKSSCRRVSGLRVTDHPVVTGVAASKRYLKELRWWLCTIRLAPTVAKDSFSESSVNESDVMKKTTTRGPRAILSVDVGGSHVKVMTDRTKIKREFESDPDLSAKEMVKKVKELTKDWPYDVVSMGYPGPVVRDRTSAEPYNLGRGWKGFDFARPRW
jgi:hypothetical protein